MKQRKLFRLAALSLLFILSGATASFSQTLVQGIVTDASTKKPLARVSVYFGDGKGGVLTGEDGSYQVVTYKNLTTIVFSYVGYKKTTRKIIPGQQQVLNVALEPASEQLAEISVKSKRGKYSNKHNPAVELIDLVIQHKASNRIAAYDYVQYDQYEKLKLSLTRKPEKLMNTKLFKNYRFVLENADTTTWPGKSLLPMYISEKISKRYLSKSPKRDKLIILGEKQVNYGDFLDNNGIGQYLSRLYADIDIYDNNINILFSQFLSPIADMGPTFYRYYIRDTVEIDGVKLVKLYFTPKNPTDLIFRGTMYVTLDGNYGVQKIEMTISKSANVNWTRELKINQDFEKASDGRFHVIQSTMMAEFALTKNAQGGIFGERTVYFKNFIINQPAPDSIYENKDVVVVDSSAMRTDSFWTDHRDVPLSEVEAKAYHNIDSLRDMKSFKRLSAGLTFLFAGYLPLGKWELGNTNTFYSFNPVEGFKPRLGGRTTPAFSKTLYFDHYIAYGLKDHKVKYLFGGTYSFNHKSIYSYPLNYLRLSYQHDTKIPGQELVFYQEDNFLLSFKRGNNDKWLYNDYFKADYVHEFGQNFSYTVTFKYWKQMPAGDISYQKAFDNSFVNSLTTSEISAELRWAPNEQFYQGKDYRIPIINKYPIFRLRFSDGIKGLMNGEYNYKTTNLHIEKRFYLSQLGYADAIFEGGYIFGQLPYPLLTIHRANQTYAYQINSYNLMNFMEFVSDRYASSNMDFYFNGFFLNKLPLIKKLKLREVASFKILYGGVRDENNPLKNTSVFKFPTDNQGRQTTYTLNEGPYMEMSVGVANIFKLLRLDLVKRLTYLDHPDVSKIAIRGKIRFDF